MDNRVFNGLAADGLTNILQISTYEFLKYQPLTIYEFLKYQPLTIYEFLAGWQGGEDFVQFSVLVSVRGREYAHQGDPKKLVGGEGRGGEYAHQTN